MSCAIPSTCELESHGLMEQVGKKSTILHGFTWKGCARVVVFVDRIHQYGSLKTVMYRDVMVTCALLLFQHVWHVNEHVDTTWCHRG